MGMADVGRVIQDSLHFALHDREGRVVEELTVIPDAERLGFRFGGVVTFPYLPFAGHALFASGSGIVAMGSGGRAEFLTWAGATQTRSLVRWPRSSGREARDWIDAYVEDRVANARSANDRRYVQQLVREAPLPQYLPVYQAILVARTGHTWIERYRAPGETTPEWDVFREDGAWLGTVQTPQRFRIMEIGPDYLAGVFRDDLDVEYVRVYELVKP